MSMVACGAARAWSCSVCHVVVCATRAGSRSHSLCCRAYVSDRNVRLLMWPNVYTPKAIGSAQDGVGMAELTGEPELKNSPNTQDRSWDSSKGRYALVCSM